MVGGEEIAPFALQRGEQVRHEPPASGRRLVRGTGAQPPQGFQRLAVVRPELLEPAGAAPRKNRRQRLLLLLDVRLEGGLQRTRGVAQLLDGRLAAKRPLRRGGEASEERAQHLVLEEQLLADRSAR